MKHRVKGKNSKWVIESLGHWVNKKQAIGYRLWAMGKRL
jgi:hypothetical protein